MAYSITDLKGSGKEIIRRVMLANDSQLLIPPRYEGRELEISAPPPDGKYIGLFSSGTTGKAKCIWNSFENLMLNARLSAKAFDVKSRHFLLMMASPWHVAGFTWLLMAEHLDSEYLFITTKKGDHNLWIHTVQDVCPDYLFTVPAVLRTLYDEDWFTANIAYGGYPIEFHEYEKIAPHCSMIYQGYGQTEAGGLISAYKRRSTVIPEPDENLCNGFPVEGAELRCAGKKDTPQPIYIKSPSAFTPEFYNSGDIGYKDEKGRIYVANRREVSRPGAKVTRKTLLES